MANLFQIERIVPTEHELESVKDIEMRLTEQINGLRWKKRSEQQDRLLSAEEHDALEWIEEESANIEVIATRRMANWIAHSFRQFSDTIDGELTHTQIDDWFGKVCDSLTKRLGILGVDQFMELETRRGRFTFAAKGSW